MTATHFFQLIAAVLIVAVIWAHWPRKRDTSPGWQARKVLMDRFVTTPEREARDTLLKAGFLSYQHPDLSPAELIRLAYWGASGEVDHEWRRQMQEAS